MKPDTISRHFFDGKYASNPDPWQFASSIYELARYDAVIDALAHRRYHSAFEPGCSIGVLTARLAGICDRVQASDISPVAVQSACVRCKELTNVEITCGALPEVLPQSTFDLIVLSEVGYYLDETQLLAVGTALVEGMEKGGVLLASHWLGKSQDHVLTGDRVHEVLFGVGALVHEHSERHDEFRLDRWVRL